MSLVCGVQVYVYSASTFALRCKCDKHTGPVKAIDFSSDSAILQTDGADYEHNYCKPHSLTQLLTSATMVTGQVQTASHACHPPC